MKFPRKGSVKLDILQDFMCGPMSLSEFMACRKPANRTEREYFRRCVFEMESDNILTCKEGVYSLSRQAMKKLDIRVIEEDAEVVQPRKYSVFESGPIQSKWLPSMAPRRADIPEYSIREVSFYTSGQAFHPRGGL